MPRNWKHTLGHGVYILIIYMCLKLVLNWQIISSFKHCIDTQKGKCHRERPAIPQTASHSTNNTGFSSNWQQLLHIFIHSFPQTTVDTPKCATNLLVLVFQKLYLLNILLSALGSPVTLRLNTPMLFILHLLGCPRLFKIPFHTIEMTSFRI